MQCRIHKTYSYTDISGYPRSGHHNNQLALKAGKWMDEDAVAYVEFAGDSLMSILSDSADSIIGLRLHIRCGKSYRAALPAIGLCLLAPKADSSLVSADTNRSISGATTRGADTNELCIEIRRDGIDSIRALLTTPGRSTVNARYDTVAHDSVRDTVFGHFAFALFSDSLISFNSSLAASGAPVLRLRYAARTSRAAPWTADSISLSCLKSDYSVTESAASSLDSFPVSSAAAGRYAVMAVDMRGFWRQLDDTAGGLHYRNILTAVMDIAIDSAEIYASDAIDVYYNLYADTDVDIDTSNMIWARITRTSAATVPQFALDSCLLSHINDLIDVRPDTGYLYLTIKKTNGFARIRWHAPDSLRIRAVLSNPW